MLLSGGDRHPARARPLGTDNTDTHIDSDRNASDPDLEPGPVHHHCDSLQHPKRHPIAHEHIHAHNDSVHHGDLDSHAHVDENPHALGDIHAVHYIYTISNLHAKSDHYAGHPFGDAYCLHHILPHSMTDILPFLKSLISVSGLSGYETPVAKLIEEKWRTLVDETSVSRVGSLHGLKIGSGKSPRPSVMIATHMDAIGMMVSSIEDGFLHITNIGGVDIRVLPGADVTVHASSGEELPAIIAMPPARFLPGNEGNGVVAIKHLLVDTGLTQREVEQKVRVGDLVSFANEPLELAGEVISGHTLDNRASVAALTVCLEELQGKDHVWDVWAVATVQEETSYLGGYSSAFQLRPDIAIAVDGTFAKGPGANDWQTHPMGKGVGICMGPNMHPYLHRKLTELADNLEIPWFLDVTPKHSGTDAYPMQTTMEGIPTALVEYPLRYMHTTVESVAVKDIQRAGRLLAEFIASLDAEFVETIVWE